MIKKYILVLAVFILSLSFIYANGCCFYTSTGLCSNNIEQNTCSVGGGQWSGGSTCAVSECSLGCCVTGTSVKYNTQRSCEVESLAAGFTPSWQASSSSESCSALVSGQEMGACIFNYDSCSFVERSKCSPTGFHVGKLCTDPSLNTRCNTTTKTKCFDEGVYYLDSCGNRDALVQTCDYAQGFTCRQKSSTEAYCKSLNCDYKDLTPGVISRFLWKPESESDGKLVILFTGGPGGGVHIYGPTGILLESADNLGPNNGYADAARFSKKGGDYPDGSLVRIGTTFCKIADSSERVESCIVVESSSLPDELPVMINGDSWCAGDGGSSTVGSRFFKQACIDGKVVTEPCADYRNEQCVSNGSNAKCVATPGEDCYLFNYLGELDPATGLSYDQELCTSENGCVVRLFAGWNNQGGRIRNELAENAGLDTCAPLGGDTGLPISVGYEVGSLDPKCSAGNFEADIFFNRFRYKRTSTGDTWRYWAIVKDAAKSTFVEKDWGRAGLFGVTDASWSRYQCESGLLGSEACAAPEANIPTVDLMDTLSKFTSKIKLKYGHPIYNYIYREIILGMAYPNPFEATKRDDVMTSSILAGYLKTAFDKRVIPDHVMWWESLPYQCTDIGDCGKDANWAGVSGSGLMNLDFDCIGDVGSRLKCTFKYACGSWSAPSSGNCEFCGSDGLPCSEYRCQALGKNCEYTEPRGIDTGACVSSSDLSSPAISHSQTPSNPLAPYSSVKIKITTNKDSYCKFDFSSQGGTLEGLSYETSQEFSRNHEFELFVPGYTASDEDLNAYPFLTRDGNYTLFVRCEGANGVYNIDPYLISLQVMNTPDTLPPTILEFVPSTNSFVENNKTEKQIRFKLNEPAECRWDLKDKSYDTMGQMIEEPEDLDLANLEDFEEIGEDLVQGNNSDNEDVNLINSNQLSCDLFPSSDSAANGYWCSGLLYNITQQIGQSTKYYIRCKDQPILEGKEDEYYKRNSNQNSFEYILKPSKALEISSISPPAGDFVIGSTITNITYEVRTINGAENGKADCKWRYFLNDTLDTLWTPFNKTNSSSHQTKLTSLVSANYRIDVICTDIAGNKANASSQLNIIVDTNPPSITRLYNDRGSLKITLDEKGSCKSITRLGCSSVYQNGSNMNSLSGRTEFTTILIKNVFYSISCQDDFGNSRCFDNIIFY